MAELFRRDHVLLKEEYDVHERTVSHRLAIYIENLIGNHYDVDVEYNRMRSEYGNEDIGEIIGKKLNWEAAREGSSFVYPDIIAHKRDQDENLFVIEVKMAWKSQKKNLDYQKLNYYISDLNYRFGVYIELSENIENCVIEFGPFDL